VSDERSRGLIDELVRDLAPVRRIPRLRAVAAVVAALWLLWALLVLVASGARPGWTALVAGPGPAAVAAGLTAAGLGALIAALARSVPGREGTAAAATTAAGAGLCVALAAALLQAVAGPAAAEPAPLAADAGCQVRALLVALAPAGAVAWFSGRALAHGPLAVALAAATGAAALGGVAALSGCPWADPRHLLTGHGFAPVLGAALLTLPVLIALRAFRARQSG
jgi:hypothetical protein